MPNSLPTMIEENMSLYKRNNPNFWNSIIMPTILCRTNSKNSVDAFYKEVRNSYSNNTIWIDTQKKIQKYNCCLSDLVYETMVIKSSHQCLRTWKAFEKVDVWKTARFISDSFLNLEIYNDTFWESLLEFVNQC